MKRIILVAAGLSLLAAPTALAQDHAAHAGHGGMDHAQHGTMTEGGLKASSPAEGSTVSAPKTLTLTFAHAMKLDSVALTGPNGVKLNLKAPAKAGETVAVAMPALASGAWKAAWHATSTDGHMMHGVVSFTVR